MGSCAIHIEPGLLSRIGSFASRHAPAHRYGLVSDANVAALYGPRVFSSFPPNTIEGVTVPAGEQNKTRESWAEITDHLLQKGLGRDSALVALGGGMIGDLAGFTAATFLRGIPVIQVPTSLLAMVDAAIGGKTGLDVPGGKNLVGSFHMPAAVLIDPQVLATLPLNELRSGLAEVIKCGAAVDEGYFAMVRKAIPRLLAGNVEKSDDLEPLIVGAVGIKVRIVAEDERESGLRKVLNFGHTIGHAVELVTGYSLLHGEAVAIGMAVESDLAERIGVADAGTASRIKDALTAAKLPIELPAGCRPERMLDAMRSDKKTRGGTIRFALPRRVGEMAKDGNDWSVPVADELIMGVLA